MSSSEVLLIPNVAHPNDSSSIIALSVVKEALRLPSDITDEDTFLQLLVDSAEIALETTFGIVLRSRQYIGRLPCLYQYTRLRPQPITTAPVVTYSAVDLTTKTITLTDFSATPNPTIFIKDPDTYNNDVNLDKIYPFLITATCGPSSIPKNAKIAILQIVAYMYKNRELATMNNEDARESLMNHYLNQNAHILNVSPY